MINSLLPSPMKTKMLKNNDTAPFRPALCSRRDFLAGCVTCAGALGAAGALSTALAPALLAAPTPTPAPARKPSMKIRVVFASLGVVTQEPCWPNIAFDFAPVMEKYMAALAAGCPEIEFTQSMVTSVKEARDLVAADNAAGNTAPGAIDGYLVIHLVSKVKGIIAPIVASAKPVLYANFLFAGCGTFLGENAAILRAKAPNYAHISSSDFSHVAAAANCLLLAKNAGGPAAFSDAVAKLRKKLAASATRVDMTCAADKPDLLPLDDLMRELKTKKILAYEGSRGDGKIIQETKDSLGITIIPRPFSELNDLWEKADKAQAMEIVHRWKKTAAAVLGVRDMTLEKSARLYLAMKQCLAKHDACAITINCLGGFYGGHINAYPCLGFHELLNEGLIGACECDLRSTVTMVVMTTLTKGRPGYISDPVLDVATKQIIYAHCVASNKAFGPAGASNPFTIMTHSEDRQGASVRSMLPEGRMTTTLEIHPDKKAILLHQAKAVGNSDIDRACRTKLIAVPLGDFEKLHTHWDQWSWHRVTYYGDLKSPVLALANTLGWKVIEEA